MGGAWWAVRAGGVRAVHDVRGPDDSVTHREETIITRAGHEPVVIVAPVEDESASPGVAITTVGEEDARSMPGQEEDTSRHGTRRRGRGQRDRVMSASEAW